MKTVFHEIAQLFIANGFGFGKYWNGYIFGKTAKDEYFLYLSDTKMAILSAGIDEDGEKTILTASDELTQEELNTYFSLDYNKKSKIDWLEKEVNIILVCANKENVKKDMTYFMWPAVQLKFSDTIKENSVVIYDRFTPKSKIQCFIEEAMQKGFIETIECWSMIKYLSITDKFGEFAPKICMEAIPRLAKV